MANKTFVYAFWGIGIANVYFFYKRVVGHINQPNKLSGSIFKLKIK